MDHRKQCLPQAVALALRNGGVQGRQVARGQAQFLLPQSSEIGGWDLRVGAWWREREGFSGCRAEHFPCSAGACSRAPGSLRLAATVTLLLVVSVSLVGAECKPTLDESLEPPQQITPRARSSSPPCEVEAGEDPGLTLRCSDRRSCLRVRIRVSRLLSQPADAHGSGCV